MSGTECPFVKHEVDVGVGVIRDCDAIYGWDVEQIVSEMEGYAGLREAKDEQDG